MSASRKSSVATESALGGYVLRCKIDEQGPGNFLATVTAIPDFGAALQRPPESESRRKPSRADAFRACAQIGFAMEARLSALGFSVRDWPPRPRAA